MPKIAQPHDAYIRSALSQPEVAKGFLRQFLPKKILKQIDLNTLEITKETFVEPNLNRVVTDILFKVNINQKPGYLFLLLEHQSTPDKLMTFRLVRYTVNILRDHLERHKNDKDMTLPVVVPLILYNGAQKYNYSTNFFDLFGENKKLMEDMLVNGFPLIDFKTIPDEKFREDAWSGIMCMAMKHIYDRDFSNILESLVDLFSFLEKHHANQLIVTTLKYGIERGKIEDKARFFDFVKKSFSRETGDQIMTLARQLQEEGLQKGLQEGRLEGQQEGERATKLAIARNMLLKGMSIYLVEQITDLPLGQIEQLKNEEVEVE